MNRKRKAKSMPKSVEEVIRRAQFAALILPSRDVQHLKRRGSVLLQVDLGKFLVRDASSCEGLKVKGSVFIIDGVKNAVGVEILKA